MSGILIQPFLDSRGPPLVEIAFNKELPIYHVWLDGHPVLHVIDTYMNFHAAAYVTDKSADGQ